MVDKLQEDLRNAQLARDQVTISTLRLLLSEVKNLEIAKGVEPTDEDIISVVGREVKKRKEAAAGFRSGNREDQALKEEAELVVLQSYLPAQLPNEELTKIVEESINELGASSITDMGKVIGVVMSKTKGAAEGSVISAIVKEKLTQASS